MKRQSILVLAVVVLLSGLIQPCQADLYFSDDFDDGNADGWWLYDGNPPIKNKHPKWSIESGILMQSGTGDHIVGLVENLPISDQLI